jgi:hypothetical protein
MRLARAALAELVEGKGATSSSKEIGFAVKSKLKRALWLSRASGDVAGSSSYSVGPSRSSPRSWGSVVRGLAPRGSGGAI